MDKPSRLSLVLTTMITTDSEIRTLAGICNLT